MGQTENRKCCHTGDPERPFLGQTGLSQSQAQQGSTATAPPGHTFTHNGPMMAHRRATAPPVGWVWLVGCVVLCWFGWAEMDGTCFIFLIYLFFFNPRAHQRRIHHQHHGSQMLLSSDVMVLCASFRTCSTTSNPAGLGSNGAVTLEWMRSYNRPTVKVW